MAAGKITDIKNPWRDNLVPASYRGAFFHVEAGSKENGRRIVEHEFPKKDDPYAEDMGRSAYAFTVRAYCISYMRDEDSTLYRRDYRIARDLLLKVLQTEGDGVLQLPYLPPIHVVCARYRMTEEEKLGGYCTFDMQFLESGVPPFTPEIDSQQSLLDHTTDLVDRVLTQMLGHP